MSQPMKEPGHEEEEGVEDEHVARRAERLRAAFAERFGEAPAFVARAPGRVNLIGEHVDYSYVGREASGVG